MSFILQGKKILVLSPEHWGNIMISKHNYAVALARRGNTVYFFNPIDESMKPGGLTVSPTPFPGLSVVQFRPWFPLLLKFKARKIYDLLMRLELKRVLKKLSVKPDIVWDFNCSYEFPDLSVFGAACTVFQPVDFIKPDVRSKKADVMVTISSRILQQYERTDTPRLLVSHGVSEEFVKLANMTVKPSNGLPVRVGYVGNLTIGSLDRELLRRLIEGNPASEFHLVGPYNKQNNNLGINSDVGEMAQFADFLSTTPNVKLYGTKPAAQVAEMLPGFDILLICYKATTTFQSDNSHKILEYMAAGKLILTTYLAAYEGNDLILMSGEGKNHELLELFKKAAGNLSFYNADEMQQRRKRIAIDNSYDKQLSKIEEFISSCKK